MSDFLRAITEYEGLLGEDAILLSDGGYCRTSVTSESDGYFDLIFTYSHSDWDQWIELEVQYENGSALTYMLSLPPLVGETSATVKLCYGKNRLTVTHCSGHELTVKGIRISEKTVNRPTEITPSSECIFKDEIRPVRLLVKSFGKLPIAVYDGEKALDFKIENCDFDQTDDVYYSGDSDIRKYLVFSEKTVSQLKCGEHNLVIEMQDGERVKFNLSVTAKYVPAPFRIISFDVGHGNSTLLRLPNHKNLLIDSGYAPRSRKTIFEYLKKHHISVDYYLLTHFHIDHNGMLDEILKRFSLTRPDQSLVDRRLKMSFSQRSRYLSGFQYLDSTMLCRYDRIDEIWDLGGVKITALNSRFEKDGTPIKVEQNPAILYGEHNYENATSISMLIQYNGFGYYHGADNYSYIQQKNYEDFKRENRAEELKCHYFYANHHFHHDVNSEFIRYVNPVAVYIPANQAIYTRSAYRINYIKEVKEKEYFQKRLKDTFISHESGSVEVNVVNGDNWYYRTL